MAADAIRYVLDESTTDSFTWMLAVPAAGSYQLYARWVAASANTSAAQYTVTHAGGSSPVSQKQNGGQWHLLGTNEFAPDAGHKVRLAAAAAGTAIADAILLVGSGAPPSNLLYVHADHLGTPQKLTDADQEIVWDGEFEPFGEEVAISGTAELPLRFPGQYADAETGYSYNYFRDYEPTLGRYLQSDPIGLAGGINTFAYVGGDPVSTVDPTGEFGIAGAVIGGSVDLAIQLAMNGGDISCVNWTTVGLSMVAGALTGGLINGNFALKTGSTAWKSAVRPWLGKHWNLEKGQHVHHAFIGQNSAIGNRIPTWIKNQPWNLTPMPSRQFHEFLHKLDPVSRTIIGAPGYAQGAAAGLGVALAGGGRDCRCR